MSEAARAAPVRDPLSQEWVGVCFTNPVTGERIEVLEIGQDRGELLRRRLTVKDEMYLASPPLAIQRILWTVFASVGRLWGRRPVYDRYLRPGFWEETSDREP